MADQEKDPEVRRWIVALVKRQMARMGLAQVEVARRTGMKQSTLSQLLNGQVKGVGLDTVVKLHRGLKISGDLLLGEPDWKSVAGYEVGQEESAPLMAAEGATPYGKPSMTPAEIARKKMDEVGAKALASIPKEAEALRQQMKTARKKQIR